MGSYLRACSRGFAPTASRSTPALAAFDLANLSEGGDQSGVEGLSPRDSRRISLVWLAGGMSCSLEPEQELSVLSGAGRIAKGIKQSP